MIIVSDTSALTALLQIGQADLLAKLYQRAVIPTEVANELLRFHTQLPAFIEVLAVSDRSEFQRLACELDPGEAAAIVLMLEGLGDLLLLDEQRGRSVANREGVPFIGLLGLLIEAKAAGYVTSMTQLLTDLEQRAGFHSSEAVKRRARQLAGES